MVKLMTMDEFLFEKAQSTTRVDLLNEHRNLYKNIFRQFKGLDDYINEAIAIVDAGIFDTFLIEDLATLNESEIYEGLLDRIKTFATNAMDKAKEQGKKALSAGQQAILKLGGGVVGIIKFILEQIVKALKAAWDWASGMAKKAAAKAQAKVTAAVEGVKDISNLATEVANFGKMLGHMKAWVLGGFSKEAAGALKTAVKTDEGLQDFDTDLLQLNLVKAINEAVVSGDLDFSDMLKEDEDGNFYIDEAMAMSVLEGEAGAKIPFLSAIAGKLNKIPPFSLLYKVKKLVADFVGTGLSKFSKMCTEVAGAPGPFKFVALATLIGIFAEMEVKHAGEHMFHKIIVKLALPGLGTVLEWTVKIAKYLAYFAILEVVLKAAMDKKGEGEGEEEAQPA